MYDDMDQWTEIRRLVLTKQKSKRAICQEYQIHWKTLQKMLTPADPRFSRSSTGDVLTWGIACSGHRLAPVAVAALVTGAIVVRRVATAVARVIRVRLRVAVPCLIILRVVVRQNDCLRR